MTIDDKVWKLAASVCESEAVLAKAQRDLDERQYELREALAKMFGVEVSCIELGSWACETSPTGQCVYDCIKDPALDECLFCGQPDERK